MKFIKNWKTVLIISYLLVNSILFYVLLNENQKLPSENWSRSFVVEEYKGYDEVVYNVLYPSVHTSTYDGYIITSYFSESNIIINYIDDELNIIKSQSYEAETDEIIDFKGYIIGNKLIHYIQSKNGDGVLRYVYDLENEKLMNSSIYNKEFKYVAFYEEGAVFSNNDEMIFWDGSETTKISDEMKIESIGLYKNNDIWNILTIESSMGSDRMLKKYIIEDNQLKFVSNISALQGGGNYKPNQIKIHVQDDHIKILTKIIQEKYNQNYINIFNFDDANNQKILEYSYTNEMSITNSTLLQSDRDEIKVTQSHPVNLGMRDISSKDETYFNLFIETYSENGDFNREMFTKTIHSSNHPNYVEFKGNEYLQWTESREGKNVILFSSTNDQLIKTSKNLMKGEFWDLLWSTFSSNMLMLYFFLFISVSIILPIVFTIIPISLIFFNWAEKNQVKLFNIAIGIHLLSKFNYIFRFIKDYRDVMITLPGILSNQFFQYGLSMFTSAIAYYCLVDFLRKRDVKNFLFKYLFFFVIDIMLLVLILVPYRML